MDVDEMAKATEWHMEILKMYAIQYAWLRKEGRKTRMKAKMIRRKMQVVKNWLEAIEMQLEEDEK